MDLGAVGVQVKKALSVGWVQYSTHETRSVGDTSSVWQQQCLAAYIHALRRI